MSDSPGGPRSSKRVRRIAGYLLPLAAALIAAGSLYDMRVQQSSLEGDELVHVVLADQLRHGSYSPRGTIVTQLPQFSRYLYDRAVHYNPPLYNLVLLGVHWLLRPTCDVYVSLLASVGCAWLVYRMVRRRADLASASFAMLVFMGCPIVYLVSCRVWAEALLALLICAIVDVCERVGEQGERANTGQLMAVVSLCAAAAMVKASILFAVPGLVWLGVQSGRGDLRLPLLLGAVPLCVSAGWLVYVYCANQAAPPLIAPIDDRFANPFVAELARKPALSLFYLPFCMNPGYLLAPLAFTSRVYRRVLGPHALCVLGTMAACAVRGWSGATTHHTKYVSTVMPLLAVLAGMGFAVLGQELAAAKRGMVRGLVVVAVVVVLASENAIHREHWVAEVDPALYLATAP